MLRSSKKDDEVFIAQTANAPKNHVSHSHVDSLPPLTLRKSLRHDQVLPAPDGGERSHSTLLMQKTHENLEAQAELQKKRQEFHSRMVKLKEREKNLQLRRIEFNEQVAKFTKFMNDNEEKRSRANKRAAEEIRIREGLENDIKLRIAQLEQLKVQKEQSRQALEANVLYQKYLETVVEQSDDFGSVNDILTRYATLHDARALLQVTADSHSHEIDATRTELSSLIKEKQNEVLVLNSLIVELKQKVEAMKDQVARRETELSSGLNSQQQRSRTMGEIEMAINNLYSRLQLWHPRNASSSLEKLDVIKRVLLDTKDIINGDVGQVQKQFKDVKITKKV